MSAEPKPTCMIPGCSRKLYGRGLCGGCYKKATVIMKRDGLTWDDLIDLGLAQGEFTAPFVRAYNKAVAAKKAAENPQH